MEQFGVNRQFPIPYPYTAGCSIEIWSGSPAVIMSYPDVTQGEIRAFNESFSEYSYYESDTPVPIALTVFRFPAPCGDIEVNYAAPEVDRESLEEFLDSSQTDAWFYLLDAGVLRAKQVVSLHPFFLASFKSTIRLQLKSNYNRQIFAGSIILTQNRFSVQEIFAMGVQYQRRISL